jgi:hypothetical protein
VDDYGLSEMPGGTMSQKEKVVVISIVIFIIIVLAIPLLVIHVYLPFAFSGGIETIVAGRCLTV